MTMDWYPHKIDAYDGKTRTLSLAEDGAYCRLLRWYYKHEEPLPDNDAELAAICRCSLEEWLVVAPKVRRYFVTRDAPSDFVLSAQVLVHEVCKKILFAQNSKRRDWKARQAKLRKNNGLEDVTRDAHIVTRPEERRGEEKEVSTPAKSSITPLCHPLFDDFWRVYPRHAAKQNALKAFNAAVRIADPQKILAGAKLYAKKMEQMKTPEDKIAHGATWLNAQRWTDEYRVEKSSGSYLEQLDNMGDQK